MIWWTEDPSRFRAEREAIAELVEDADWLTEPRWRLNDGLQFVADFEIAHLGRSEPLSIIFPSFFPAVPPLVIPREGFDFCTYNLEFKSFIHPPDSGCPLTCPQRTCMPVAHFGHNFDCPTLKLKRRGGGVLASMLTSGS